MKQLIAFTIFCCIILTCIIFLQKQRIKQRLHPRPSALLHFTPVSKESDRFDIMIAQAELVRHEIECKVDGKFGKQTAFAICELLCKLEDGYKIRTIYKNKK